MADARSDFLAERERLQADIERLEAKGRQLDLALGEFEHESRRVGDALERLGGRSAELEARAKTLAKNRKLTEADLAKNADARDRLERRHAQVSARIERLDGGLDDSLDGAPH